jgi:hypothetical protein
VVIGLLAASAAALWIRSPPPRPNDQDRDAPFITLGELARELAGDKNVWDAVIGRLGGGRTSVGVLEGAVRDRLRAMFAARDFSGLDREPRTDLETLALALRGLAAKRGTSASVTDGGVPTSPRREDLGIPTRLPAPSGEPFIKDIGFGLLYGDRLDPEKAPRFRDSERLAQVFESLAQNSRGGIAGYEVLVGSESATSPEGLAAVLRRSGHTVTVNDERFEANFGDLIKDGHPVATPLWIRTGRRLGDAGDELALPVPHAQLAIHVRGPSVDADVTFFNSLDIPGDGDGGTKFRADVTQDQPWVGGRVAHRYEGDRAVEAIRLMALIRRANDQKVRDFHLPLDGYFALGVCTLAPAVVEQSLEGRTTLWPLTQDPNLFRHDDEIDRLVRAMPVDGRGGPPPDDARIFASVPWEDARAVPFPEIRDALVELGGTSPAAITR